MADSTEYKTKIKIEGDSSGVEIATAKTSRAIRSLLAPLAAVRTAVSAVMRAFGVFYLAAEGIRLVVGPIMRLREEMRKTSVEAQKLKNATEFSAQTHAVDALADRYKGLTKAIQDSSNAAKENARIAAAALDAQRKNDDAQLKLREEQEVAALDRNDPDYSNKVAEVRRRYASQRTAIGAERSVEDEETKLKQYKAQATDEDINAATYAKNAEAAKREEVDMRRRADLWGKLAEYGKQRESEGFVDKVAGTTKSDKMLADFFGAGGDQSYMQAIRGMKPDEIAAYAAEQQKAFAAKADKAGETAAQFQVQSAESAQKAKTAAELAKSQEVVVQAARTRKEADSAATETANADASAAQQKNREAEQAKQRQEETRTTVAKLELDKQREIAKIDPTAANFSAIRAEIERNFRRSELEARREGTAADSPERTELDAKIAELDNQAREAAAVQLRDAVNSDKFDQQIGSGSRLNAMGLGAGSGVQRVQEQMASSLRDLVRIGRDQINAIREIGRESGTATFS